MAWKSHSHIPLSRCYSKPQYYVNRKGKEMIIFVSDWMDNVLLAYDVAKDKYITLIDKYTSKFCESLCYYKPHEGYQSFIIDNDNQLLYSYDSQCANGGKGTIIILDLKHYKIINEKVIDSRANYDFEHFSFLYEMFLINQQIHFVLGRNKPNHWIYNIKDDTLKLFQHPIDSVKRENYNAGVIYSKFHKQLFIFGGSNSSPQFFNDIYSLTINDAPLNDKLLVSGFTNKVEKISKILIPDSIKQLIYEYYFIPNDKEWNKLNVNLPTTLGYFGCILTENQNDVLIFGGRIRSKHLRAFKMLSKEEYESDKIYRFNIMENKFYEIKQKCPIPLECYAVYCPLSKTVHLFEYDWGPNLNKRHWSIDIDNIINQ